MTQNIGHENREHEQVHILLVEDDAALRMGLEYALQSEGFSVRSAADCKAARSILFVEQTEPDLVILDVMLPDGTGYELCSEIAAYCKSRLSPGWPVIFLSACDSEVNVVMGLDGGGDDYITKPFRVRELISRVNAVLRRKNERATPTEETIIRCGPIAINLEEYRIWLQGQEIQLTVMEFRLLSALIRNRGRIMSRQSLLQSLWDNRGAFIDDNTLSVHINHLREKLEKDPGNPQLIQTIRGVGYRLCPEESDADIFEEDTSGVLSHS